MKTTLFPLLITLSGLLRSRAHLHLENLALRQQLAMITHRDSRRPRFHRGERLFWVWFYRLWADCRHTLRIFSPGTSVGRNRKGFWLCWRWKSRYPPSERPPVPLRSLIAGPVSRTPKPEPIADRCGFFLTMRPSFRRAFRDFPTNGCGRPFNRLNLLCRPVPAKTDDTRVLSHKTAWIGFTI